MHPLFVGKYTRTTDLVPANSLSLAHSRFQAEKFHFAEFQCQAVGERDSTAKPAAPQCVLVEKYRFTFVHPCFGQAFGKEDGICPSLPLIRPFSISALEFTFYDRLLSVTYYPQVGGGS